MIDNEFICLGKVAKPHGIRGEFKIYPYSGQPDKFYSFTRIWLSPDEHSKLRRYEIERSRELGKFALLKLSEINSRTDAEKLVGQDVYIQRDDLPELDDDEYYWHDFTGRQVVTEEGRELGIVTNIFGTGGHDVLTVAGTGREYLIPVHTDFLVSSDQEKIVLRLPPGLLDINM